MGTQSNAGPAAAPGDGRVVPKPSAGTYELRKAPPRPQDGRSALRNALSSQTIPEERSRAPSPAQPRPPPARTHEDARQLVQHPVLRRRHALQVLLRAASLRDGTC